MVSDRLLVQWREKLGIAEIDPARGKVTHIFPIQRVIDHAELISSFRAALMAVASSSTGISNIKLGRWLRRVEGKVIGGFRLQQSGMRDGYPLWGLFRA